MKIVQFGVLMQAAASLLAADFEAVDQGQFETIFPKDAKVETIQAGFKFTEGPVWIDKDGGYLVFSDIPANELKKWSAKDGVKTFRAPSQKANGNSTDNQGRLISAEHWARRVSVTEADGSIKTVVDQFEGKKFNSPNDVVVSSKGIFYFTDPAYGLENRPKEQAGNYVYRHDPNGAKTTVVAKDFDNPNGLCLSPDEKKLYVADSGKPHHIRVFDIAEDGSLKGGSVFCVIDKGGPDGIRADEAGRIWSSSGDGVQVFTPEGKLVARVLLPKAAANLCFGGADGKTVFITARDTLFSVKTLTTRPKR